MPAPGPYNGVSDFGASDSPCHGNISTMNEWGPGVNLPYYVKAGLEWSLLPVSRHGVV